MPAYAAAAAALGCELTLPEVSQTVILTRTSMRSSAMPPGEDLASLGASGATLAIHLSIRNLRYVVETLRPIYGGDCPVVIVYRVTWPDQTIFRGTLADIYQQAKNARLRRTALIMVGRVFGHYLFPDSKLYDAAHAHLLRPKKLQRIKSRSD